jgi:hypothetical protein
MVTQTRTAVVVSARLLEGCRRQGGISNGKTDFPNTAVYRSTASAKMVSDRIPATGDSIPSEGRKAKGGLASGTAGGA